MSKSARLFRGLPVYDATKATTITVTKRDIGRSESREPDYCMIATAFKREQHREAVVHTTKIYVRDGNHWLRYPVPQRLQIEIIVFDRFGAVAEGEFQLRPPGPTQRLDYRPPRMKKPTAKKKEYHRTPDIRAMAHYGDDK